MAEPEVTPTPAPAPTLASKTVDLLRGALGDDVLEVVEHRGETTIVVAPRRIAEACQILRDDAGLAYNFCADITAVDWPEREPRFDVVYHLMSLSSRAVIRLKVRVGDEGEDEPVIPSVTDVWPAANWYEREIFDLFGIRFDGHPDLRRIMMPDDWTGHPLRKDYPLTGITLPDPHWGGQIPFGSPLPTGTGAITLRTPGGVPNQLDVEASEQQRISGEPPNEEQQ